MKFCRELDDINFVEMRNIEQQAKSLRKSKNSKNHRERERYSEDKYSSKSSGKSDKSDYGTISSRHSKRRGSRSQSIQKTQPIIEAKPIKSDYLVGYENRSIISYGSEDSVSYSESPSIFSFSKIILNLYKLNYFKLFLITANHKNSNSAKNDAISLQSGFSTLSTSQNTRAKHLPPPFDCESIDKQVDDEAKQSRSDLKSNK